MKMMRKIATLLLAICLVVPCFSMVSHAANRIMFEDPSTAVGEQLALKGVIQTDSAMEDRKVVMTYDTTMLKFVSGDNVTETATGQLTYEAKGVANARRVEFIMNFDVLKEGTTQVKVESYTVYSTTDVALRCEQGYSTIKIAAGTAPTLEVDTDEPAEEVGAIVEVDGASYTFTQDFEASEIPEGFVESTMEYAGTNYKVVMQEETGLYLGYLVNADGEGKFFLYVSDNATFAPFVQVEISDSTVITFLSDVEDIVLAEPYEMSQAEINGSTFPAWQNTENTDLWILYAMSSQGESSLYQFDSVEGTYQRFEVPVVEEEEEQASFMAKLDEMLGENINTVIYVIGIGFILLLVFVIVLSVKLYNRNAELDELYDEYGIDLFDDELGANKNKKDSRIINLEEDDEDDDFDYRARYGLKDEEEDSFVNISEETEDDIVIAELDQIEEQTEEAEAEEIEAEENEAKEDEVEEVEAVVAVEDVEDPEEAIRAVAAEIEKDEKYWDDEDDLDFEINFIDLDD